ncbi:unnamed protein product [Notodromas monacha]|uniref:Class II aldolase/adducin N-terminal domain-containing protein n=1 Tax=Notodromas monacha TaxID=399045 RepID=A0A7R9GBB7_9CRUS|nr:unnamed protein product [Notodromas monacha]CAG0914649.1 unnamed protein product [Notodromas monacha]
MSAMNGATTAEPNGVNDPQLSDEEDEETRKLKMRPPDIDQDMRDMERRKRVELIMGSRAFKDELERIVEVQLRDGGVNPSSLLALQQLYDATGKFGGSSRGNVTNILPIADIRGVDCMAYTKGEKLLRCKLAAVYRLVDLFGWSQGIYNHITLRTSQDQEHFLINPFGLQYSEVTASSLIKVDLQGNVIDPGTTNFGINMAGYTLHSAIHAARPGIRCIIHIHSPSVVAVSSLKCGLLPVSQESCIIGDVSYHDYHGIVIDPDEKESLSRDLGPVNKVMILRNHGAVCCGETVEEAFYNLYHLVLACDAQVSLVVVAYFAYCSLIMFVHRPQMKLMPAGVDNLVLISDEARKKAYEVARQSGAGGVNSKDGEQTSERKKWRVGEMEFEALMRSLDNAGYRSGYMYKNPLVRTEPARLRSDVEVPPSSTSYTHVFDEEDLFKYSPLKKVLEGRKAAERTRWLNSPNTYQRVEVLETGTMDPKKITKWVADQSPTHSTSNATKVDDALQFVPKNTDPKEFKKKQKQIKENRKAGGVSAGPQSHILEGVPWDEARAMQDGNISANDSGVVMVGAASKGIIQRDFQHNAVVYRSPYAKNPFDQVTEQDLVEYREIVEKKQRGEPLDDTLDSMGMPEPGSPFSPQSPTTETEEGSSHQTTLTGGGAVRHTTITVETSVAPSPGKVEKHVISPQAVRLVECGGDGDTTAPSLVSSSSTESLTDEQRKRFQERTAEFRQTSAIKDGSFTRGAAGDRDRTLNGDDHDVSKASRSSREGSPSKGEVSMSEESSKADKKKKKKGIRTPSFLKKKKDKKPKAEAQH